ncbi:MAG: hypothetical protein AAGF01_19405 [Cyanobacteria bacterium P01_G01_bin.38]
MNTPPEINRDKEQLKLLSTFHYVVAGITALFSLMTVPHMLIGLTALSTPELFEEPGSEFAGVSFGWLFFGIGSTMFLTMLLLSIGLIVSAGSLRKRKNYWLSFVIACAACLFTPFGTVLGIFTLIVLSRQSVKQLYGLANST